MRRYRHIGVTDVEEMKTDRKKEIETDRKIGVPGCGDVDT